MLLPGLARPSRIREYIARSFPRVLADGSLETLECIGCSGQLAGLVALLEALDPLLLAEGLDEDEVITWAIVAANLRHIEQRWSITITKNSDATLPASHIRTVDMLLAKCPDQATPRSQTRLQFIIDPAMQRSLAEDVDAVERLIRAQEWKAATVLAGAFVEAVLLDRLQGAINAGRHRYAKPKPLLEQTLGPIIDEAETAGLLSAAQANAARAVQHFRNLIHPGRVLRVAEQPTQAGALFAAGAMHMLIERFQ